MSLEKNIERFNAAIQDGKCWMLDESIGSVYTDLELRSDNPKADFFSNIWETACTKPFIHTRVEQNLPMYIEADDYVKISKFDTINQSDFIYQPNHNSISIVAMIEIINETMNVLTYELEYNTSLSTNVSASLSNKSYYEIKINVMSYSLALYYRNSLEWVTKVINRRSKSSVIKNCLEVLYDRIFVSKIESDPTSLEVLL